MPHPI